MQAYQTLSQAMKVKFLLSPLFFCTFLFPGKIASTNVLPNGSYQYSVDITLPPGTNNMQPQLSLQYNSLGPNGIAGVGWVLQGLPIIARINNGNGVNFDGNDTYFGPGGKLVDISGQRTLFHTEAETFAKFEPVYAACGLPGNEPCSWVMTDSSGTKYYFGSSSNSIQEAQGGKIAVWFVDKIADVNGNYFTVEYEHDAGEVYPSRIIYTKNDNAGIGRYRAIEFIYDKTRTDTNPKFTTGVRIETKWRLQDIVVKTGILQILGLTVPLTGDQIRRYHLTYEYGQASAKSRLIAIQEFGSDNQTSLPPIIFTWSDSYLSSGLDFSSTVISTLQGPVTVNGFQTTMPSYVLTGDFNGDGKIDIASSTAGASPDSGWCVQHGNGFSFSAKQCMSGGLVTQTATTIYDPWFDTYFTGPAATVPNILVGDFDGDGRADLAAPANSSGGWCIMRGNSTSFDTQRCSSSGLVALGNKPYSSYATIVDLNQDGRSDILTTTGGGRWCIAYGGQNTFLAETCISNGVDVANGAITTDVFFGDVNGDGKMDAVSSPSSGTWCVMHGDGVSFSAQQCVSGGIGSSSAVVQEVFFKDFNGDGRLDIANNGCVMHGNTTSFDSPQCNGMFPVAGNLTAYGIVGDFDGDGKADILTSQGGRNWCVSRGNGTAFDAQQCISNGIDVTEAVYGVNSPYTVTWPVDLSTFFYAGDFNGDGRLDIGAMVARSGTWSFMTGSPQGLTAARQSRGPDVITPAAALKQNILIADFTGDGRPDIIARNPSNDGFVISRGEGPNDFDLLKTVTNISGAQTTVDYQPISRFSNAILPNNARYPIVPNKAVRTLVKSITINDGRGASYTTTYDYKNGLISVGSGNPHIVPGEQTRDLGFETFITRKPDGQQTVLTFLMTDPDMAGSLLREQQYDANGVLIADIANSYTKLNPFPGTKMPVVTQKIARAYEGGTLVHSSVIDMNYDSFGYLTSRITTTAGFPAMVEKMQTTHDLGKNIYGIVIDTELYLGSLQGQKLKHLRNIYNASGATCGAPNQVHLICEKHVWLDQKYNGVENRFIITKYTYEPTGTLQSETDPLNRMTQYIYDSDYRSFPVEIINAKGQHTKRTYDAGYGLILTETDVENGTTVSQEFDVFGRLVRLVNADGTIIKQYFFMNQGNPNAQYVEVRLTDDSSDGYQWSREYTDGLARIYKRESEGVGMTAYLRSDITFDTFGRKASESNSYLVPGGTPRITNFTYDSRGRTKSIIYPEIRQDGTGRVTTTYAYSTGNVSGLTTATTTATDANGNGKTIHKDARGQTVKVSDPMGASVRYGYDDRGRLVQTTDADGNITTVEYDSIGRKIRMVEPNSGTVVYRYDDAGNMVEQVDGKAQSILFTYDELGRVTLKDLPGNETDVVYEYDRADSTYGKRRLSKVSDAAGVVEYNYDKRGNVTAWKRTIDGYAFAFSATYDAQNRVQQTTYPDGYRSRNYLSDAGNLRQVRMLAPGGSFGSALVTYQGPETTGQAEILRNLGNGVTSKIGFDDSTRRPLYTKTYLKNDTAYANPVQHLSYEYDDVGNVEQITDHLNGNRTEAYSYDNLYRLIQAQSGMYGTKTYSYTAGGNMKQNGNIQLYFAGSAQCTGIGNLPTQAVCADSRGNQYSYDLNGNMTKREGRDLEYTAEDRLKAIKENGVEKLSFVYNYAGERVKKARPDGAITYWIGGLYEVQKKPDGSEVHTKYFGGIKGDRVAQVTKDSSQVTLTAVTSTSTEIYLASGRGAIMSAVHDVGNTIAYLFTRRTSAGHLTLFLFIVIGGLGVMVIRSRGPNMFAFWRRAVATPALVCFLTVIFIDCSGSSPANNGTPWETTTGSTAGIPALGASAPTYNDTTLGGMPVTGTFFLVPNHLGSTALVTDASGNTVISELHYEPYGEVVASASTGPDIIRNTYTGQVRDAESSLMYYGARYYDPKLGRFLTPDSIVPDAMDSQGYNRYMYVKGNPVLYTDPTGHFWFIVAVVAAAVIGGVLAGTKGNIAGWLRGEVKFDWGAAWKGALAGALAAAGGAWAGAAVTTALGGAAAVSASLTATIAVGFTSGFAAGFVGSAASAWLNGESFLDGLAAGFQGAAIGGLTGGALAGVGYGLGKAFNALSGEADTQVSDGKTMAAAEGEGSNGGGGSLETGDGDDQLIAQRDGRGTRPDSQVSPGPDQAPKAVQEEQLSQGFRRVRGVANFTQDALDQRLADKLLSQSAYDKLSGAINAQFEAAKANQSSAMILRNAFKRIVKIGVGQKVPYVRGTDWATQYQDGTYE
ncbi:MAG: VCBS repeat-containing protein [Turneriella sp.]|nr:VCBS repeat-containing protein [Turneriella sp.]